MAGNTSHKIMVILSSVRDGRHGVKVGNAVMNKLKDLPIESELLDPLEINAPMLTQPLHFMPDPSEAPSWMPETKTKLENSSGFIFVCAEYNATIPPALTNLLDYFPPNVFRHKPASIVTYSMGPFGGIRAPVALRPFLGELGMVVLPSGVTIPSIQNSGISEDGTMENERIEKNINKMCTEHQWYVQALESQKSNTNGYPN